MYVLILECVFYCINTHNRILFYSMHMFVCIFLLCNTLPASNALRVPRKGTRMYVYVSVYILPPSICIFY